MTPPPGPIEHEENDEGGAFFLERAGKRVGEMTYRSGGAGRVTIEHTEVSPELGGQGVGRALLDTAVAWARATGTRITATCPFARAQFDKDFSIRDVLS